jgi:hypothetical protein
VERAGPANLQPRYGIAFRDGRPALAVSAQRLDLPADRLFSFLGPLAGSAVARLRLRAALTPRQRAALSLLRQHGARALVCGSAVSCGPEGVVFGRDEEESAMWPTVLDVLERMRETDDLYGATDVVLIKDLPAKAGPAEGMLASGGYRPIENEPDMVLELDPSWKTRQDYLSGMSSRYRRPFEKTLRRVEDAGFRIEHLTDAAGCADEMHELYLHVQRRARWRPVAVRASFFPMLLQELGDAVRCMVLREPAGRMAGFVTILRDRDTTVGYLMGYDPEINRRVPVYLRLLQLVVEEGLRSRCRFVSLGRTALDPKARLGAEPVPLKLWIHHGYPALHEAVQRWLRRTLFERVPARHPFR